MEQIKKGADNKKNWLWNAYPLGWIADYVSWFFANFVPITPNQISFLWEFIELFGIGMIALGGYKYMLLGIIIYHCGFLFDYVDGQIARARKITSYAGAYLDLLLSWINRSLIMLALGTGLYFTYNNILYFYLGLCICIIFFIDNLAKLKVYETLIGSDRFDLVKQERDRYYSMGKRTSTSLIGRIKNNLMEMLRPFSPFSFVFWGILLNISQYYLILMAVLVPIGFIMNFTRIYLKIASLPKK